MNRCARRGTRARACARRLARSSSPRRAAQTDPRAEADARRHAKQGGDSVQTIARLRQVNPGLTQPQYYTLATRGREGGTARSRDLKPSKVAIVVRGRGVFQPCSAPRYRSASTAARDRAVVLAAAASRSPPRDRFRSRASAGSPSSSRASRRGARRLVSSRLVSSRLGPEPPIGQSDNRVWSSVRRFLIKMSEKWVWRSVRRYK